MGVDYLKLLEYSEELKLVFEIFKKQLINRVRNFF